MIVAPFFVLFPKHILTPSSSYKPAATRFFHRLAGLSCKRLIFSEKKYKNYADPEIYSLKIRVDPEIFSCKIRVNPEIYQSL